MWYYYQRNIDDFLFGLLWFYAAHLTCNVLKPGGYISLEKTLNSVDRKDFTHVFFRLNNLYYTIEPVHQSDYILYSGTIFHNNPLDVSLPNWHSCYIPNDELSKFPNNQPIAIKMFRKNTALNRNSITLSVLFDDPRFNLDYLVVDQFIFYSVPKGYSFFSFCDLDWQKDIDITSVLIYILFEIASGMEYLHRRGFAHHALNLQSIFICSTGEVKIFREASQIKHPLDPSADLNEFISMVSILSGKFPSLADYSEISQLSRKDYNTPSFTSICTSLSKLNNLSLDKFRETVNRLANKRVDVFFVLEREIYVDKHIKIFLVAVTTDASKYNPMKATFKMQFSVAENPFNGVTHSILKVSSKKSLIREAEIMRFISSPDTATLRCYYFYDNMQANTLLQSYLTGTQLLFLEYMNNLDLSNFLKLSTNSEKSSVISSTATNELYSELLEIFVRVVKNLHAIHSKMVVHGNIKMNNIYLDKSSTVKLGNFGQSFVESDKNAKYIGSPGLLPPEARDINQVFLHTDRKADIYALGLTMLEAFTFNDILQWSLNDNSYQSPHDFVNKMLKKNNFKKPIFGLIKNCIEDDPELRPSCENILHRLTIIQKSRKSLKVRFSLEI